MFDPNSSKKKDRDSKTRSVSQWALESAPEEIQEAVKKNPTVCTVNVREIQCGDPQCAPIDTVIAFIFGNGRRAMTALPLDLKGVRQQDVQLVIGDMGEELKAAHENRDWARNDAPIQLSPAAEAAVDRIALVLKQELTRLGPGDVAAVCQTAMDMLEQFEEDAQSEQSRPALATGEPPRALDPNARILSAAQKNDVEGVKRFLEEGISPSYANSLGQTPLHIAAMWGNTAVCETLIEAGADVHATNQLSSATPLHAAAASSKDLVGRAGCAKLLIAAGANLIKRDADGMAPWQKTPDPTLLAILKPQA